MAVYAHLRNTNLLIRHRLADSPHIAFRVTGCVPFDAVFHIDYNTGAILLSTKVVAPRPALEESSRFVRDN